MLGLALIFLALFRRREAIGGWLLYFLWATICCPLTMVMRVISWINRPSIVLAIDGDQKLLTYLLLTTLLVDAFLVFAAVTLLRKRDWPWVQRLRILVGVKVVIVGMTCWLVATKFPSFGPDVSGILLLSVITLAYFWRSRRVRRVFLTKDWQEQQAILSIR